MIAAPGKQGDTSDMLVTAAICLFAERGFHGLSLRAVAEAAGAKNTAAVHYHFGDREGLLRACLERVLAASRAHVSGDSLEVCALAMPQLGGVHEILTHAFLPMLTLPAREDWGASGIKLLARVVTGEAPEAARFLEEATAEDTKALADALQDSLLGIERDELIARLDCAYVSVVCGLAALPYLRVASSNRTPTRLAPTLMSYVTGGVQGAR